MCGGGFYMICFAPTWRAGEGGKGGGGEWSGFDGSKGRCDTDQKEKRGDANIDVDAQGGHGRLAGEMGDGEIRAHGPFAPWPQ